MDNPFTLQQQILQELKGISLAIRQATEIFSQIKFIPFIKTETLPDNAKARPTDKLDQVYSSYENLINRVGIISSRHRSSLRELDKNLEEIRRSKGCSGIAAQKVMAQVHNISAQLSHLQQTAERLENQAFRIILDSANKKESL